MGTVVQEKTHATLGPSGAHCWAPCPGSVVLSAGLADNVGDAARWGTAAHELAAIMLEPYNDTTLTGDTIAEIAALDAESYLGRAFTVDGKDYEVDGEMATCVNDYLSRAVEYMDAGDILFVEQELSIEHITGEKGATGTSDLVVVKPAAKTICVIDLKTGRGVMVYAEKNEQCAMYGEAARHSLDLFYGPFEFVQLVIIQPRIDHFDEETIDAAELEYRIAEIAGAAKLVEAARHARESGPLRKDWIERYLSPGAKQCKFCRAKTLPCPALTGAVSEAMSKTAPARAEDFPDLSLPKQASAAAGEMPSLDAELLAEAKRAAPLVEIWLKAVNDEVHARLLRGDPVPGFFMGTGPKGNRAWADEKKAEEEMKKARLKVDEMYTKKLLTFPAAEKAFKKLPVWSKLAGNMAQAPGGPIVCKEGDDKPRWTTAAKAEDFPELEVDPFA